MRPLLLLFLLIGCGGDDDGDTPGAVSVRTTFTSMAASPATTFAFDADPAIESGDQLVALIHATSVDQIEMTASPGWTVLAEDLAVMCTGSFHTWFVTAPAGTAFDFTFDQSDTFTAVATAYAGAGRVALMDFKKMGELRNMQITYAAATLAPNSAVWMAGGGQTSWSSLDSPVGVESLAAIGNVAAFQLVVADGAVPAIELPNDNGFCANVAQLSIEP